MTGTFFFADPAPIRLQQQRICRLAKQYDPAVVLLNNQFPHHGGPEVELLAAVGAVRIMPASPGNSFSGLRQFRNENPGRWLFGFLTYELKNEILGIGPSAQEDDQGLGFPLLYFFIPQLVVRWSENQWCIEATSEKEALRTLELLHATDRQADPAPPAPVPLQAMMSRKEYLEKVALVRQRIREGEVYEMNLCMQFLGHAILPDPAALFLQLNRQNPAPFAAFLKQDTRYALCSSPERFLCQQNDRLLSQPIKGTIRRGADEAADRALKEQLRTDEKERAENVMIVDLVRNDLSRSCLPGSVQVEELFGIYTFPSLHQMISSVSGKRKPGTDAVTALSLAFPMGSMTGAPKIRAMQEIDQLEKARRGLYSGSIGYFAPNGDFDFNVVIRSLLYNSSTELLSLHTGSAITYDSDPASEWEECQLKAQRLLQVLQPA